MTSAGGFKMAHKIPFVGEREGGNSWWSTRGLCRSREGRKEGKGKKEGKGERDMREGRRDGGKLGNIMCVKKV